MKKLLIVLGVVLVFAMSASAQEKTTGLFAKGFKAGLNIAGHSGNDTDEYHKNLTAYSVGVFMTYMVAAHIALQPELLYTMKGYKWDDGEEVWKGKYNYLEVPVLFKYLVPTKGNTKPNLFFGPSFGFLMSATDDETWTVGGETFSESVDVKDYLKGMELGMLIGAGVSIAMGNGSMIFDIRYQMGMSNVYEPYPEELGGAQPEIKSKMISFLVGYGF